jgi:lipoate-protein ligase B
MRKTLHNTKENRLDEVTTNLQSLSGGMSMAAAHHAHQGSWWLVDLPVVAYAPALDLQHRVLSAVQNKTFVGGVILMLEHSPVYTLGRRGGRDNLCVAEDVLAQAGIDLVSTERGGDITYHAPGQLVVYPIVDLKKARLGVVDFVSALEEVMILTAADFGIDAVRNDLNRGVWIGTKKLGSIGIAVRCGVSFHGLALNVNTDLTPFGWINPCGLSGIGVISLQNELKKTIEMAQVRHAMVKSITKVFNIKLHKQTPETLFKSLSVTIDMENLCP